MSHARNVFVMVHGMIPTSAPGGHQLDYDAFWSNLLRARHELRNKFEVPVQVEWGQPLVHSAPSSLREDQRLGPAEDTLEAKVSYRQVRKTQSDHEVVLSLPHTLLAPPSALITRLMTDRIKEQVALFGLTDVVYYCSEDGERAVRRTIYKQVLERLVPLRSATTVRLHVFGHSLGVTISFDFLYGLFAPSSNWLHTEPDFVRDELVDPELRNEYRYWRKRAHEGTLLFGSCSSSASQLPLLVMRKQKLVDRLAQGLLLDASVIGVRASGPVCWKLFYDVDDILGFPSRPLYQPQACIQEFEVSTGWEPLGAHVGYWKNDTVITETANMLAEILERARVTHIRQPR